MNSDQRLRRAPTLPEAVARALRQEIDHGLLVPGDRLQSEQKLALRFDVSRPVIREAISRLKYDGLVISHQGRGVFVAAPTDRQSFRIDPMALDDSDGLNEIFELRMTLEAEAAALAAKRRSDEHLAALRAAIDEMEAAYRDMRDAVKADVEFHKIVAEATGNTYFRQFVLFLRGRIYASIRAGRQDLMEDPARLRVDIEEHKAIYAAIESRDPDAARNAICRHLTNAAADLQLALD